MEQERKPRNKPHTCGQLICKRGGKNIQWRKDSFFNKWCWENWTATCEKNQITTLPNIIHKNKLKMD